MIAIAAVDENWGIGNNGELLVSIPEDQKGVFRKYTSGHTVVFGRKTLATFRDEKLLPNRTNIIMTRNPLFEKEGAVILHSEAELSQYASEHQDDEIFVIGGAEIYKTLLPLCTSAIITHVHATYSADAHFPDLDSLPDWELTSAEPPVESVVGVTFDVRHYSRSA